MEELKTFMTDKNEFNNRDKLILAAHFGFLRTTRNLMLGTIFVVFQSSHFLYVLVKFSVDLLMKKQNYYLGKNMRPIV